MGTYITQLLGSELNFLALCKDFYYYEMNWIMKFIDLFNELMKSMDEIHLKFDVKIFWVQNFSHFCEKINYQNLAKCYIYGPEFSFRKFLLHTQEKLWILSV